MNTLLIVVACFVAIPFVIQGILMSAVIVIALVTGAGCVIRTLVNSVRSK